MSRRFVPQIALFFLALLALPDAVQAQGASVTARIEGGQSAEARAIPTPGEGVLLEFLLPDGRSQVFPQLGESLVPIDGQSGAGLVARDLNGDGLDEVIIRGSVPPERGAMLVFRWDSAVGEFVPIEFTDDRDRTNPYAVVDAREPIVLHPSGTIEVHFQTVRQDGRKSYHVARFRWNGQGFTQSADN